MPLELPRLGLTSSELKIKHYGLAAVAPTLVDGPIAGELEELREYLTTKFILNRPKGVKMVSTNETTWYNNKRAILQFMGFAVLYRHHQLPRLSIYRDDFNTWLAFISFLLERKVEGINFYVAANVARRVLAFLQHKATQLGTPYSTEEVARHEKQLKYIESVSSQLGPENNKAKLDKEELEAQGKWVDAVEIVYFTEQVANAAKLALRLIGGAPKAFVVGKDGLRPAALTARKVHDAALVSFNFGYMPPIRPTVLCSIRHPSMAHVDSAACKAAGCTVKQCRGNRLEQRGRHFHLVLAHHKNAKRWGNKALHFQVPEELEWLLEAWVNHGWHYLRRDTQVKTLFFNTVGGDLTLNSLSHQWQALLKDYGIQACLPPRRLRHIFVTHRLEHPELPGPSNESAAVVMGNSVDAWKRYYHVNFQHYGAKEAVERMGAYRQACLDSMEEKKAEVEQEVKEERKRGGEAAMTSWFALKIDDEEEEEGQALEKAEEEWVEEVMEAMDAASDEFEEDSCDESFGLELSDASEGGDCSENEMEEGVSD